MINILMYVTNGLILLAYLIYLFLFIINRNKKVTDSDGFNITKDILDEYDSINIIENKSYFTIYNIRRRVVKIASMCYYGNSLSDITISLMEASISVTDNKKNKLINICRYLLNNLKLFYLFPIAAILINSVTYSGSDAKASIVFLCIFLFLHYLFMLTKSDGVSIISKKINKNKDIRSGDRKKVIKYLNTLINIDRLICISEFIMLFRFVMILIEK